MHANPVRRSTRPGVARWSRTSLAVLAAGAILLGACGDDDDAAAVTEEPTTTPPTTTAPTAAAEDREPVASSPSGELALVGTWASNENGREQTFTADGEFFVTLDGEVLAEGTYTATATTLELVPRSGVIACAETGTYEWDVDDDTLTLTVVEDECEGRRSGLDGVPRERVATDDTAADDLVGTWVSTDGPTWEVTEDSISAIRGGQVVVVSSYTATDTTLEMTDVSGPRACASDLVGTYQWEIDDEVLTLTSVSDDCEGRNEVLGGRSFERSG